MAMYTGVNAFKKINGIENEVIAATQHYETMKSFLDYVESKGGYPKMAYILDYLGVEEVVEETDKNYYKYHSEFLKIVQKNEELIQQIEEHKILDKVKKKEVFFTTREYDLAKKFQETFDSEEFYFRKIVEGRKIAQTLKEFAENVEINNKYAYFENVCDDLERLEKEYFFEVHVS